jgi:hypothetical protein
MPTIDACHENNGQRIFQLSLGSQYKETGKQIESPTHRPGGEWRDERVVGTGPGWSEKYIVE